MLDNVTTAARVRRNRENTVHWMWSSARSIRPYPDKIRETETDGEEPDRKPDGARAIRSSK